MAKTSPSGSTSASRSSCGFGRPSTRASSSRSSTSASPTAPISARVALAPRRLRRRGAEQPLLQRRPPRREAARGDPAHRARPRRDARAGLLRLEGARALYGAQVHRGRPRERRADRRRRSGRPGRSTLASLRPGGCGASSRSRFSGRASTFPTSTASSCCGRPRQRRCSPSSSGAACGAPPGKSHLTVIDLIGQHRREFRFEDRLRAILDTRPRHGR